MGCFGFGDLVSFTWVCCVRGWWLFCFCLFGGVFCFRLGLVGFVGFGFWLVV